jgi:16S rRNA (cytosine967-C5)-methyltransferase
MQAQQSAMLERAARLVKPGGRLVYATCSLLRDENEIVAKSFLQLHPGFSLLDAAAVLAPALGRDAQSLAREGMLRLWPHRHGTDGFFGAVFERA